MVGDAEHVLHGASQTTQILFEFGAKGEGQIGKQLFK